jgi:hypothetical protein
MTKYSVLLLSHPFIVCVEGVKFAATCDLRVERSGWVGVSSAPKITVTKFDLMVAPEGHQTKHISLHELHIIRVMELPRVKNWLHVRGWIRPSKRFSVSRPMSFAPVRDIAMVRLYPFHLATY